MCMYILKGTAGPKVTILVIVTVIKAHFIKRFSQERESANKKLLFESC